MPRSADDIRHLAVLGKGEYLLDSPDIARALVEDGILIDVDCTDARGLTRFYGVRRGSTLDEVAQMTADLVLAARGL
ncbi:MAG: hypothetical protein MUE41_07220 [Gemmatimonadaceae bacterium]|jgi:hypothetical protein|nr:hypothetical protein [Gemmatimonadaceae bacterium]